MKKITIDFETRSEVDLGKCGPWKYASDPTTQVMCLAVKVNDEPAQICYPDWVTRIVVREPDLTSAELVSLVESCDIIEAHNCEFERAVFSKCWPKVELPLEKCRCTAAKAATHSLPRDLERACQSMKMPIQKDKDGWFLMKKMCVPRKPTKDNPSKWVEDAQSFRRLFEYCLKDVDAEHAFSEVLRPLSPSEQSLWFVDQKINARGIHIDPRGAQAMIDMVDRHREALLEEFVHVVENKFESPSQVAKLIEWLKEQGVVVPNLTKEAVNHALNELADITTKCCAMGESCEKSERAIRALQIRQSVSKTSTAKYQALLDRAEPDSRIRSLFMFCAAGTGRWGGRGFQPQNLPSRGVFEFPEEAIEFVTNCTDPDAVELLFGNPFWIASSCVRSTLIAPPGKDLIVADYSAIEGRVLAWLAGEEYVLEAYRNEEDMYKIAAESIYHKDRKDISKAERQIGKVCELACGYQGGIGAFGNMAQGYGVRVPEEEAKEIVRSWRESRPETVRLWKELERAAMLAVKNPEQLATYRSISFKFVGNFLGMRLPSGRVLYYPFPFIGEKALPWDKKQKVPTLKFWGVDSTTNQWCEQDTYGGCLAENATQAVARDILAGALVRLEGSEKYRPILHVHDEIGSEVGEGLGDLEEYLSILTRPEPWAAGLPMKAEGWIGKRYRK